MDSVMKDATDVDKRCFSLTLKRKKTPKKLMATTTVNHYHHHHPMVQQPVPGQGRLRMRFLDHAAETPWASDQLAARGEVVTVIQNIHWQRYEGYAYNN
jgi:hypothetical protein